MQSPSGKTVWLFSNDNTESIYVRRYQLTSDILLKLPENIRILIALTGKVLILHTDNYGFINEERIPENNLIATKQEILNRIALIKLERSL